MHENVDNGVYFIKSVSESICSIGPMKNQTMGIAIAMVTGQSGKMAAEISPKLHSVVGYIVYFSNIRKISNPLMCLSGFASFLMQYAG